MIRAKGDKRNTTVRRSDAFTSFTSFSDKECGVDRGTQDIAKLARGPACASIVVAVVSGVHGASADKNMRGSNSLHTTHLHTSCGGYPPPFPSLSMFSCGVIMSPGHPPRKPHLGGGVCTSGRDLLRYEDQGKSATRVAGSFFFSNLKVV